MTTSPADITHEAPCELCGRPLPPPRGSTPLPLGTPTRWGPISAVGTTGGERYYWMVDADGCVSMMPTDVVEDQRRPKTATVAPTATAHSSP